MLWDEWKFEGTSIRFVSSIHPLKSFVGDFQKKKGKKYHQVRCESPSVRISSRPSFTSKMPCLPHQHSITNMIDTDYPNSAKDAQQYLTVYTHEFDADLLMIDRNITA
jgi:hypothetical protein